MTSQTSNQKGNCGYYIKANNDGRFNLVMLTNTRNLPVESWVTATVLDIKSYSSIKTSIKKGEIFLKDNN